jgi:hypothetical protein
MGCSLSLTCFVVWQYGGGVYIATGTVTFQSCQIYSNTAINVRFARRHQTRHHAHPIAPMGCLLWLTFLCMAPLYACRVSTEECVLAF